MFIPQKKKMQDYKKKKMMPVEETNKYKTMYITRVKRFTRVSPQKKDDCDFVSGEAFMENDMKFKGTFPIGAEHIYYEYTVTDATDNNEHHKITTFPTFPCEHEQKLHINMFKNDLLYLDWKQEKYVEKRRLPQKTSKYELPDDDKETMHREININLLLCHISLMHTPAFSKIKETKFCSDYGEPCVDVVLKIINKTTKLTEAKAIVMAHLYPFFQTYFKFKSFRDFLKYNLQEAFTAFFVAANPLQPFPAIFHPIRLSKDVDDDDKKEDTNSNYSCKKRKTALNAVQRTELMSEQTGEDLKLEADFNKVIEVYNIEKRIHERLLEIQEANVPKRRKIEEEEDTQTILRCDSFAFRKTENALFVEKNNASFCVSSQDVSKESVILPKPNLSLIPEIYWLEQFVLYVLKEEYIGNNHFYCTLKTINDYATSPKFNNNYPVALPFKKVARVLFGLCDESIGLVVAVRDDTEYIPTSDLFEWLKTTTPSNRSEEINKNTFRFSRKSEWSREKNTSEFLMSKLLENPTDSLVVKMPSDIDIICEEGRNFSDDQLSAFASIMTCPLTIVSGQGGSGKTWTAITSIFNLRHNLFNRSALFVFSAFKNDNVNQLKKLVLDHPLNKENRVMTKENCKFVTLNALDMMRLEASVIFIDEGGMVSLKLMNVLVHSLRRNSLKRIVIVGDPQQLPPIQPGIPFSNLCGLPSPVTCNLTNVHRTASKYLLRKLQNIRNGDVDRFMKDDSGSDGKLVLHTNVDDKYFIHSINRIFHNILSEIDPDKSRYQEIMVLSPYKKTVQVLNGYMGNYYFYDLTDDYFNNNVKDKATKDIHEKCLSTQKELVVGMRVVFTKNFKSEKDKEVKITRIGKEDNDSDDDDEEIDDDETRAIRAALDPLEKESYGRGRVAYISHIYEHERLGEGQKLDIKKCRRLVHTGKGIKYPNALSFMLTDGPTNKWLITCETMSEVFDVIQPASALTSFRSQGNEYKTVIAVCAGGPYSTHNAMLYTMVSRTRETCHVIGSYAQLSNMTKTFRPPARTNFDKLIIKHVEKHILKELCGLPPLLDGDGETVDQNIDCVGYIDKRFSPTVNKIMSPRMRLTWVEKHIRASRAPLSDAVIYLVIDFMKKASV